MLSTYIRKAFSTTKRIMLLASRACPMSLCCIADTALSPSSPGGCFASYASRGECCNGHSFPPLKSRRGYC